ncbi:unnamed protein product [Trichobilharzia regenti]|nr:unnamed protein product [Trichobilharzia regenti]
MQTARNTGIINCWDCETGELIGYLFLNDRCYCLSVSPVLPLAVTGMNSGTIMFIDCTSPTSLRIVKVTRLYRKPLTHICFDTNGEYLTTAVDDGPSIVISALPTNSFEPIAHVCTLRVILSLHHISFCITIKLSEHFLSSC